MNIKNNKNCKITINDKEIEVSEKEKTADELFKELGYKKVEDKYNIDYNKIYSFTNGDKIKEQIRFCKLDKYIHTENYNFDDGITFGKFLDTKELQAINKKCKELRLDIMKINNLKESIEYFKKINNYGTDKEPYYLQYELSEAPISFEWYKAILNKIKKYKPKRVIDIGSNINLFGYLFSNEGIEYIGIDIYKDVEPLQTNNIKFIHSDYYKIREQFKNDICISCLCVGYLIPIEDVICRRLIINSSEGTRENYKCTAKEIFNV